MAGDVTLSQALSYARDLKILHQAALEREQELTEANARLRAGHRQSLRYAADLKKTYQHMERTFLHSLLALANALEARDPYTRGHSERVASWSRRLALAGGLPAAEAETIAKAGLLHDLGKIGISECILRKPGPLSEIEWEAMREHPLTGARILAPLEFFGEGAVIVRHHHERQDGTGYPDGLSGETIPLGARVVAVADVYDALTSDRPYRPRFPPGEAIARLRQEAGRRLDPDLTVLFIDVIGDGSSEHPV